MTSQSDAELDRAVLDAIPAPLFVVDDDVRIVAFNSTAASILDDSPAFVLKRRGGEALHCIHSTEKIDGCGATEACKTCVVRTSVNSSIREGIVVRRPQRMQLVGPQGVRDTYFLITTSPLKGLEGRNLAALLLQDIGELISTQGIVPVCMHCRKVRNAPNDWASMEQYLKEHFDLDVSHGLCPDCLKKYYSKNLG